MKYEHDRSVPMGKCPGCAYRAGEAAGRRSAFRSIARWARERERDIHREYLGVLAGPLDVNDESFQGTMAAFHDCARECSRRARGES